MRNFKAQETENLAELKETSTLYMIYVTECALCKKSDGAEK